VMAHPGITSAILGPRTMPQLDDLLAGAEIRLTDDLLDPDRPASPARNRCRRGRGRLQAAGDCAAKLAPPPDL